MKCNNFFTRHFKTDWFREKAKVFFYSLKHGAKTLFASLELGLGLQYACKNSLQRSCNVLEFINLENFTRC